MTNSEIIFEKLKEEKRDISLTEKERGNGKKLTSKGKGELVMKQPFREERIRLTDVLHVPDINMNLLSIAKITSWI